MQIGCDQRATLPTNRVNNKVEGQEDLLMEIQ
jgi:hypothetical protein